MSETRIAIRYAKPLLEMAEEAKALEAVRADLASFIALCSESREFVRMLKSPVISHLKKATILKELFGKRFNPLTSSFFDLVARKNRENLLHEIAVEFQSLYNDKMGFQEATVSTAVALDDSLRKAFLKLITDLTGKKPILKENINPELVGGYVLRLGDRQIDESISGQLKDLKLKFTKETV